MLFCADNSKTFLQQLVPSAGRETAIFSDVGKQCISTLERPDPLSQAK